MDLSGVLIPALLLLTTAAAVPSCPLHAHRWQLWLASAILLTVYGWWLATLAALTGVVLLTVLGSSILRYVHWYRTRPVPAPPLVTEIEVSPGKWERLS
jgi:hypothetical protein